MISGLGTKAAEKIIAGRPYTSIEDFVENVDIRAVGGVFEVTMLNGQTDFSIAKEEMLPAISTAVPKAATPPDNWLIPAGAISGITGAISGVENPPPISTEVGWMIP